MFPSRTRLSRLLVLLILFVLPWQTRWIFRELTIGGDAWEYGRLSLYATEALVICASLLRGVIRFDYAHERFQKPAILFLGALFLGASFSENSTVAFGAILHASAALALFALILDERTDPDEAASAFVLGLLVPCVLAWYQALSGLSPASTALGLAPHDAATLGASVIETGAGRVLRGYGSFPHPNVFGGYLAVGTVVSAWLVARGRRAGLVLPVLVGTLVVTFSRSAWIAALVGILVFLVVARQRKIASSPRVLPVAFVSLWIAVLTVAAFHGAVFARFDPTARLEEKSVSERLSEYPAWPDVIRQNAFTGVGAGNYTVALAILFPGRDVWAYQPIHNAFLLFLAEAGLLGLLVTARFAHEIIGYLRSRRSRLVPALPILVALLALGLVDHYLWSLWAGMSLSVVGLSIAIKFTIDSSSSER